MYFKTFIAFVLSATLFAPGAALSAEHFKLQENPITFLDNRAPSGKPFRLKITLTKDTDAGSYEVFFAAGNNRVGAYVDVENKEKKGEKFVYTARGTVPAYDEIFKGVEGKWYEGWWSARRAKVQIKVSVGRDVYQKTSEFAVPLRSTATIWGIVVLFLLYVIIFLMKLNLYPKDRRFDGGKNDKRIEEWEALHPSPFIRRLVGPFHLAATPIGNYSISASQIMFWSAIVVFSSVYVFFCRSDFLVLTGQVLTLLGISGGTALAAKGNALVKNRDIPDEFFEGIERRRVPRFKDLICISGIPNIFKFQIFAFTLVNGIIVLKQLYTNFNFPVIPTEQLTLMGISSGVYLGNEIIRENDWEAISKKVKEANEARDTDVPKFNRLTAKISGMLESIYNLE
jgi:hypothetical protein